MSELEQSYCSNAAVVLMPSVYVVELILKGAMSLSKIWRRD